MAVLEQDYSWSPSSSEHRGAPGWALQGGEIQRLAPKHLGVRQEPRQRGIQAKERQLNGLPAPLPPADMHSTQLVQDFLLNGV